MAVPLQRQKRKANASLCNGTNTSETISTETICRKGNYSPPKRPQPRHRNRLKKPLGERRDHVVKVGFDHLNYAKLKQLQQREGKSLSELVYEFAVNGYVKEALPQDLVRDIRALAGMANNLNQIAHEAHLVGYIDVHRQNKELAKRIDKLLQALAEKM